MKLLTKQIEEALSKSPLYSHDGEGMNAKVIVKYFLGRYTWYVTEGEKQPNGDWLLFGYVDSGDYNGEFGYFTLSELEGLRLPLKVNGYTIGTLSVECDIYFKSKPLKEFVREYEHQ